MYITVTRSGKDKKTAYVRLMEAYRDEDGRKKSRVIKNYGRLDAMLAEDPQALDKLKKKYSDERNAKKQAIAQERVESAMRVIAMSNEPEQPEEPASYLLNFNPSLHYGHYAVRSIWNNDLGLGQMLDSLQKADPSKTDPSGAGYNFSINDAVFFMTAVTVMDPDYSMGGCNYTDCTGIDFLGNPRKDTSPEDIHAALCFLKDSKDSILGWCRKKLDEKSGRDRSSCLALFTFPGARLPAHTAIAMLIDENGIPADYELFSGRASERSLLKDAIEKLKARNTMQSAVVMADSSLKNKAWCLTTIQEVDPDFHIVQSGKGRDTGNDELSPAQQAFLKQNLPLLKKSFVRFSWSLPDADHIQGHLLVCILAQLVLQLLSCRLEKQGTKLSLQEICTNLFGATVTAFVASAAEPVFLLSAGQTDASIRGRRRAQILYSTHMPDIMRACDLTPLVRLTKLPELADALGTSFASPADACPLLGAEFFA